MSAQSGRDMLVKMKNGAGDFITIAGLRTKNLKFNAKTIDITHSESEEGMAGTLTRRRGEICRNFWRRYL